MLAALLRLEKFDSNLSFGVLVGDLRRQHRHQIPREASIDATRDFTLVHRLEVVGAHELMNEEEVVAVARRELTTEIEVDFLIVQSLLFISNDFDSAALTGGTLSAIEALLKGVVGRRDNLMDGELNSADQVVALEIVQIVEVVDIVNDDTIILALLEMVGHFEVLNPLGVQVVHDDFGLTDFAPHIAFLFKQDAHAIRASEGIQVRQIIALEG
mmetsp:Transcript_18612/g.25081  ORF Transcript_18612/g.25081 Transcript_18612/m.25081 type:complete len:214 (+) Transcript_18612:1422-2063(+)